jgi:hypothetical protein
MDDETQNNDGMTRKRWNEQSGKIKYDLYKGAINKANKAIKTLWIIQIGSYQIQCMVNNLKLT